MLRPAFDPTIASTSSEYHHHHHPSSSASGNNHNNHGHYSTAIECNKGSIGFIMCECGLEDISVKTVRRLGYGETCTDQMEQKLAGIDKTVLNMQVWNFVLFFSFVFQFV